MLDIALKLLKKITSHSYQAYIVGGFVRDYLLGIESNDIDITTNATPKEIKEIFDDSCLPTEDYGSVIVMMRGVRFEITTFRKEIGYVHNRYPEKIQYVNSLEEDLQRRDFVINTLCMDEKGNILDILGGRKDLEKKLIRAVGSAHDRFMEDGLRILRAIRFATILDFSLDLDVVESIQNTKYLLRNLSYYRKREELDKIFASTNYRKGIELLLKFGIEEELEIPNLSEVLTTGATSLIGIWVILNVEDKYPFQKNEVALIQRVREVLKFNHFDPIILYRYGLYVNRVAGEIENENIKDITEAYEHLPIKSREEIEIDSKVIMSLLHRKPGKFLQNIYQDIEKKILYGELKNKQGDICQYILNHYR